MKSLTFAMFCLCLAGTPLCQGTTLTFTKLVNPIPPNNEPVPSGINNHGDIVGHIGGGSSSSFEISGGSFELLNLTEGFAYGVNDGGDILVHNVAENIASFLYSNGNYTPIVFPNAAATVGNGINDHGQIVGSYYPEAGNVDVSHGFLYSGGTYTTIDVPGSIPGTTLVTGINDRGEIVGTYGMQSGGEELEKGFLKVGDTFTTIDAPCTDFNKLCETFVTGINDNGDIIGTTPIPVEPNFYAERGFLYQNGAFTIFAAAGANRFDSTELTGINDADQIVGFNEGRVAYSFVASPATSVPEPSASLCVAVALLGVVALVRTGVIKPTYATLSVEEGAADAT
jgi:uncharacterized membrane protein